jgi:hypothetical protein
LRRLGEKVAEWFASKADAAMAEDCYEISLELPGVAATDIDAMVQDGSPTIQGEKMGRTYFFSEREYGAFQRSFRLPRATVHCGDGDARPPLRSVESYGPGRQVRGLLCRHNLSVGMIHARDTKQQERAKPCRRRMTLLA